VTNEQDFCTSHLQLWSIEAHNDTAEELESVAFDDEVAGAMRARRQHSNTNEFDAHNKHIDQQTS
jgi:hypothetical protein